MFVILRSSSIPQSYHTHKIIAKITLVIVWLQICFRYIRYTLTTLENGRTTWYEHIQFFPNEIVGFFEVIFSITPTIRGSFIFQFLTPMKLLLRILLFLMNLIALIWILGWLYFLLYYISSNDWNSWLIALGFMVLGCILWSISYLIWIKSKQEHFTWRGFIIFLIVDSLSGIFQ